MYQSQCIAVSGGKGSGRKVLKFLIQVLLGCITLSSGNRRLSAGE